MSADGALNYLATWFAKHCDGDWEHDHGIRLETLGEPGWVLDVRTDGTELHGHGTDWSIEEFADGSWLHWRSTGTSFEARCGVLDLPRALDAFERFSIGPMEKRDNWKRLVASLDSWTRAAESAPGRIEVDVPHGRATRRVLIVMTPDEWGAMWGIMWGDLDSAVENVKRTLLALRAEEGFAVYSQYRLEPSTSAVLPEPPEIPIEPGGEWFAYNPDGSIGSRLADWAERDTHP